MQSSTVSENKEYRRRKVISELNRLRVSGVILSAMKNLLPDFESERVQKKLP
jgi:hypothetical protein